MHPILFKIGDTPFYAYGFFIALGYLSSIALLTFLAKMRNRDPAPFYDLAFIAIVTGVLGSRILFVLTNLEYFERFPSEIFYIWKGGLVFYGGFVVALPCLYIYIRWKKLPIMETLDITAPALALGHALGRIGCFMAGCCHGTACNLPWAIRFDTELVDPALRNVPVHPTQLYEAISLFLLTAVMVFLLKRKTFRPGGVSMIYLMGYAILRSIIEIFRGDSVRGYIIEPWLTTSQGIAVLLFIGGCFFLARSIRRDH